MTGGPGFEDTSCAGTDHWGSQWGEIYVGVSAYQDSGTWQNPCSEHEAHAYSGWWPFSYGAIYFNCSLRNCKS